jgi:S-disulfanyl-L-cysteine oxidoreductase SoxD
MMTSKRTILLGAALIAIGRGAHGIAAAAQSSSQTIWGGVFSAAQAMRGEAIAGRRCATCHNPDLAGGQDGPALAGSDVLRAWSGTTAADLFDRIRTTMPADAPQSLSAQETADIVAFIFSQNKCPEGERELPSDIEALKQIQITPERKP